MIVLRPRAATDIEDAYDWYEAQQEGLGTRFLDALEGTLNLVEQGPHRYPIVWRNARRALISRFPYSVYFRTADGNPLILAVIHQSRDPRIIRRRLNLQ